MTPKRFQLRTTRECFSKLLLLLLLLLAPTTLLAKQSSEQFDIRILIDISGSMKENDPNNLRSPALRMLVHLLPKNSSAGVWTFGQYVNMLVKHGEVNTAWKKNALNASGQINSLGMFTNMESAISKATYNWKKKDASKRVLILLTDGYVDISKDNNKNIESKKRILENELKKIRNANGKIFTVALSDKADHDFLKYLSTKTDGLYIKADNASELNQVFLNIFENTVKTNSLPITKNSFKVDSSITDMTLLLFHEANSKKIKLYSPEKTIYSQKTPGKNINWYHDINYELITVNKPAAGNWYISGDYGGNSKILVVTNLKLELNNLPNNLFPGDKLLISPQLLQKNKPVTDEKFIGLVSFNASLDKTNGPSALAQSRNNDGKIEFHVNEAILKEGKNIVTVTAKSPTFVREVKHTINFYRNLLELQVMPDLEHGKAVLRISAAEGLNLNQVDKISIRKPVNLDINIQKSGNNLWTAEIPGEVSGQIAQFHVLATLNDNKFNIYKTISVPVFLKKKIETTEEKKPELPAPTQVVNKQDKTPEAKSAPKQEIPETKNAHDFNWITVAASVIGLNVLLIGVGFVLYRFFRKKKSGNEEDIFSAEKSETPNDNPSQKHDSAFDADDMDGLDELDEFAELEGDDTTDNKMDGLPDDTGEMIVETDNPSNSDKADDPDDEIPTISPEEDKTR